MRIALTIFFLMLTGTVFAQVPVTIPHAPWHYGGVGAAPASCGNGTIDLSAGCALGMLGGL